MDDKAFYKQTLFFWTALFSLLAVTQFCGALFTRPEFMNVSVPFYPSLHVALEVFSVVISSLVFSVGWTLYLEKKSRAIILLSCGFLGVAILDLLHALSTPELPPLFTDNTYQKSTVLVLSARSIQTITLLSTAILSTRPLSHSQRKSRWFFLIPALLIPLSLAYLGIFSSDALPILFVPDVGLTSFKVASECIIIFLHLVAAAFFVSGSRNGRVGVFELKGLLVAIALFCMSEVCFTQYTHFSEGYNLLGHVFKVLAFAFIYRTIFVASVWDPLERLIQTQIDLKHSLKIRDELLTIASHELNTPLTSVKLAIDTLIKEGRSGSLRDYSKEQLERLFQIISRGLARYEKITGDLIDATLFKAGVFNLSFSSVDLGESLKNSIVRMRPQILVANCSIETRISDEEFLWTFDQPKIERVFTNLIDNIVKHAPGSRAIISLTRENNSAVITVQDFGPGISKDHQSRIFEYFERAGSFHHAGLGLGLYICREIVLSHEGRIKLESTPGKGTRVTIVLYPISAAP